MSNLEDQRRIVLPLVTAVLVASVLFVVAKGWAGRAFDSVAIRSDAANNLADVFYLGLLLAGLAVSLRPSDPNHPEGHLRYESLAGLVVAAAVLVTAGLILLDAWGAFRAGAQPRFGIAAVLILAGSAAVKMLLAWIMRRAERRCRRPSLGMIAKDQQADVWATGAALAGPLAAKLSLPWLDPAVAVPIGIYVAVTGIDIAVKNVHYLTGRAAPRRVLQEIERAVHEHPGVDELHNVRTHHVGPEIFVSVDVEADPEISLQQAHDYEESLKIVLLRIPDVSRVFVHVEPAGTPREGHDGR